MGGTQPDSTEIKSGLLPRFPGRRACEVNLTLSCFVVWLVVVRTGVWTAQAIGHLHVRGGASSSFHIALLTHNHTSDVQRHTTLSVPTRC